MAKGPPGQEDITPQHYGTQTSQMPDIVVTSELLTASVQSCLSIVLL